MSREGLHVSKERGVSRKRGDEKRKGELMHLNAIYSIYASLANVFLSIELV